MTEGIQIAVNIPSTLGEGSIWDHRHSCLFWVDILKGLLHRYDPVTQINETREIGGFLGSVVHTENNQLILLVNRNFVLYDWDHDKQDIIASVDEHLPGNRFNDGKCDPNGRFWAGTMAISEDEATGSLYCLERDGTVNKKLEKLNISNGLVWTADKQTMYYIDTPTMEVWAFDYENNTGMISNKEVAVKIGENEGFPDGMTIDAEGQLWIAHWGGSQVARWNPLSGKKTFSVKVPASHVTSCSFGGHNLDQLFITTARKGLTEAEITKEPLAGSLFVYDTQGKWKGVPANRYQNN